MAVYAVGDVQGCCDELRTLLDQLALSPADDQLWFVGDLVNRGPQSLETLRLVRSLGSMAVVVLGNHDLHLLALALSADAPVTDKWLQPVLDAPDRDELIDWLRSQPLAHYDANIDTLMVHAGVMASWDAETTLALADEVALTLKCDEAPAFLAAMYGSKPTRWTGDLTGMDRLRFITNCLTRIRYSSADGELDFAAKLAPGTQPEGLVPWFELPGRTTMSRIVFGHWSTLGYLNKPDLLALDTGCVWGGSLTAARLDADEEPVVIPSLQPRRF